jgi:hypothetical protein
MRYKQKMSDVAMIINGVMSCKNDIQFCLCGITYFGELYSEIYLDGGDFKYGFPRGYIIRNYPDRKNYMCPFLDEEEML